MAEQHTTEVLIIGAGLAGLMAANILQQHGVACIIVEKNDSVGGRLMTHPMGSGHADLGAQFFTVRTDPFRHLVDRWIAAGLVYEWSRGWSDGSLKGMAPDGFSRYASTGGMTAIAAFLATGLQNIHLNVSITSLNRPQEGGWEAVDENHNTYHAQALLLTAPLPQALSLLQDSKIRLNPDQETELESVQYGPCLCGLFWIEGETKLPEPGALQTPAADISWVADNQRKGISPNARLMTVHASVHYSRDHWKQPDEEVLRLLQTALLKHCLPGTLIREAYLKRWQYSIPLATLPQGSLLAKDLPTLVFAGDAFGGRVEGAILSGLDAGRVLTDQLKR